MDDDAVIDQFPRFFEEARFNFAENILSRTDNGLSVISMNEDNLHQPELYSLQDLRELVRQYADALSSSGLRKGEVVARTIVYSVSYCSLA